MNLKLSNRINAKSSVFINIVLTVMTVAIFAASTFYFSNSVKTERQAASGRVLSNYIDKFQIEMNRLRDIMYGFRKNASIVLAANNKLDNQSLKRQYRENAQTQLALLKNAISTCSGAYLYISNEQLFISDYQNMNSKVVFLKTFSEKLADGETPPDFDSLTDGWTTFESFALYTSKINDYGSIVLSMDINDLAGLRDISTVNKGLYIVVLDRNGDYFSSSIAAEPSALRNVDYSVYTSKARKSLPGSDGKMLCSIERFANDSFTFLLFSDLETVEKSYEEITAISFFIITVGIIILAAMLWINSILPRVLRRVLVKYGYNKHVQETQFVDQMFQQYETRQQAITAENTLWRNMQLNMTLNYLIKMSQELPPKAWEALAENYTRYFVLYLSGQDENGNMDCTIFSDLGEYLSDSCYCSSVSLNQFETVYVLEKDDHNLNIENYLKQYFNTCDTQLRFYAGFSGEYTDVRTMREAILEARKNMESVKMSGSVLFVETADLIREPIHCISAKTQRAIMDAALHNNFEKLKDILSSLLLDATDLRYSDFQRISQALVSQLQAAAGSLSEDAEEIALVSPQVSQFYHPVYFYRTILADYRALSDRLNRTSSTADDLKMDVLGYLNQHYQEELTLESVAAHFHITPVHLSRWFKAKNNINYISYLSKLRMDKAKQLMRENPDAKNQEVAVRVGIPNAVTFIRQFRNYSGRTPEQYKKDCIMRRENSDPLV